MVAGKKKFLPKNTGSVSLNIIGPVYSSFGTIPLKHRFWKKAPRALSPH